MKTIYPIDLEARIEAELKINRTPPERSSTSATCDAWGHPYSTEPNAGADKCNGCTSVPATAAAAR